MEIFITGGTGNIGQYVTLLLLEKGHKVKMLTRTPDRIPAFLSMENLTVIGGSLSDYDIIEEALAGCDGVIHIALGWGNSPYTMMKEDTLSTAFLLETAERSGVKKFIYTSSTAALGNLRNGMGEEALRVPTDLYGATKASSEMFVLGFRNFYERQGVFGKEVKIKRNIIRPGYTYSNPAVEGGASQADMRFKNIADKIVSSEDISLPINDGTQFLSSRQIAEVYLKIIESDMNEEIFFALGNRFISWYEIALIAKELYPESQSKVTAIGEKEEPTYYSVEKLKDVLGLSFDGMDDMREHIKWNIERALALKEGRKIHDVVHEFDK